MRRTACKIVLNCTLAIVAHTFTGHVAAASPVLVFDLQTGQIIHARDVARKWYPASLTKLMTAYVTFEALRDKRIAADTLLTVSERANAQEPTRLWLKLETRISLSSLLGAVIVKSANDAAVIVAENIGATFARFTRFGACSTTPVSNGTMGPGAAPHPMEKFHRARTGLGAARYDDAVQSWQRCRYDAFIRQMNATAARLGMSSSVFANPNGLPDPRQFTTAYDLAILARALAEDYPEHAALFASKSIRFGGGRLRSYNGLLHTFEGADGMKTGFICASGFNIVASATRRNRRVAVILLGWPTSAQRNVRAGQLLEQAFEITPSRVARHARFMTDVPKADTPNLLAPDVRGTINLRMCRSRTARAKPRRRKPVASRASRTRRTVKARKIVRRALKPRTKRRSPKVVRRRKAKSKPVPAPGITAKRSIYSGEKN